MSNISNHIRCFNKANLSGCFIPTGLTAVGADGLCMWRALAAASQRRL